MSSPAEPSSEAERPAVRRHRSRPVGGGIPAAALVALLAAVPGSASAQAAPEAGREFVLEAPSGPPLVFEAEAVRDMLERTRRLDAILERDPSTLYYVGSGPRVGLSDPEPAYPWNAVRVVSDSVARVAVPANYREARRAYYGYAVLRTRQLRQHAPASDCSTVLRRETDAVSAFVDGWIVTRFLYGGPAYTPLDAFAFARDAGHLPAMLVSLGDARLGGCLDRWRRNHPEEIEAYRRWRRRVFGEEAPTAPPRAAPREPGGPAVPGAES